MTSYALSVLRTRVGTRAAVVVGASNRVTPTTVDYYINDALEQYQLELTRAGHPQREKRTTATTTATTTASNGWPQNEFVALPSDFLSLRAAEIDHGNGNIVQMRPFSELEAELFVWDYPFTSTTGKPVEYRISEGTDGTKILKLLPKSDGAYTITIVYTPIATQLSADGDTFDFFPGTVEYVVGKAALRVMADNGVPDPQAAQVTAQQVAEAEGALRFAARQNRAGPSRIVNTRRQRKRGYTWWVR